MGRPAGWPWRRLIRAASSVSSRPAGRQAGRLGGAGAGAGAGAAGDELPLLACARLPDRLPARLPAHAEVVVEEFGFSSIGFEVACRP